MVYNITNKSYWKTFILGLIAFMLVVLIIKYPQIAFQSSLNGLTTWWEVVFPALLPFFIVSEILMGLGVVHLMSVLLEPFMRPVFNVPGSGAFVLTMGLSSGYPISSKITTRLREQGLVTRVEGERLVCFTTTSDPLFMFGAIAVGFFHNPSIGIIIIIAHYAAAILLGLIMRFYSRNSSPTISASNANHEFIIIRAIKAMHLARIKDSRPLGKLLGDSVISSLHTIALIGGFMILMSVFLSMLNAIQITSVLSYIFSHILTFIGISPDLSIALVSGLFEVTLGSQQASLVNNSMLLEKVLIVSIILAWGGLSVHAQIAAILSITDLRYKPFALTRIIHAIFASIITLVIWEPLSAYFHQNSLPVFLMTNLDTPSLLKSSIWSYWQLMSLISISMLIVIFIASMIINITKTLFANSK